MSNELGVPTMPAVGGNLYAVVERAAELFPDRVAVLSGDESVTYAELHRRVRNAAHEMTEMGLQPGQRVMSLAPNSIELLVLQLAIAYVGGVSVPLNALLLAEDIATLIDRVQPAMFFSHSSALEKAQEANDSATAAVAVIDLHGASGWTAGTTDHPTDGMFPCSADGPATIVFTSGSTDKPKGCVKTHSNLMWAAINNHLTWPRSAEDVELYVVPLTGIGFANFVLGSMLAGASVVIEPFSPAATLTAMETHRATTAFFAPTMLDSLLEEEARSGQRDLSSMRQIHLSYEISDSLRERIAARFPGILHYGYGSTEGGMSVTRDGDRFLTDPTCVGRANGIDTFAIMSGDGELLPVGEEGEIVVAGPDVMLGYLNDDVATTEALHDGWLHSGDLGYIDEGGDLHYTGRFKDMIKSGGVSVAAAEVERCLTSHPGVRDAAVVGLPDEHWGEAVHAVVELQPGQVVDVQELDALCKENLATFKRPKAITVVKALPRNPGGKVAKGVLKQTLAERA